MDWAQIPIVQGGSVGVLFGVMWLVFSGRLVPRGTVDMIRDDLTNRITQQQEEITQWRAEREIQNRTNAELTSQLGVLLEIGKTTEQVLKAISNRASS
jgi:hypothetical protein